MPCIARLATIVFAMQGEPWPMPVDRSVELLPLLRSDKPEVRREALRQLVPPHADPTFRHWNHGLVPLDRRLGEALADAVSDDDPEVAAAALALLPDVVFSVGGPAEMVRRWALQKAPFTDFSHAAAAALAAADQRWSVDALLELVDAERKRDAPALPRELLDAAATILRPQAGAAARAKDGGGAPVRMRDDLDVEPAPRPDPRAPEFDGPQPTFAEVPDELLVRLRAHDDATTLLAYEELERLAIGHPLPPELLAPLVEIATHGSDGLRARLSNLLGWETWVGDPAPLLDWWRFEHARSHYWGSLVVAGFGEKWGARVLPILEVVAREGGVEDRRAIVRLLNYPPSVWGKPPLGDALLKQLMERPDAECVDDLLSALERHPAVVPSVLPQLEAWLDDPQWYRVVGVASLAGPAAASFVPKIVAHCEREKWNLARYAEELPRFGAAAAAAPLSKAFDESRESYDRVRLAPALLALHVREEEALACLVALAGDATGHPSTRSSAFTALARAQPDEPRLLAAARAAIVAEDHELLDLAWRIVARHFGLAVDDEGIVRPG